MNKRGNPKSLVASHPGNLNAVKQGAPSPRLIQARAAEIATGLTQSFDFSPAERAKLERKPARTRTDVFLDTPPLG